MDYKANVTCIKLDSTKGAYVARLFMNPKGSILCLKNINCLKII